MSGIDGGDQVELANSVMVKRLSGIQGLIAPLMSGWARRVNQRGLDAFKADIESR